MKRPIALLLVLLSISAMAAAQTRYIVFFKNKSTTTFSISQPSAYLSVRALDRRLRQHIAIDSTDLPVPQNYIQSITAVPNVVVGNVSKWLNAVAITISDPAALSVINTFPFVKTVHVLALRKSQSGTDEKFRTMTGNNISPTRNYRTLANTYQYGSSFDQVHIHNGEFLHNLGLHGEGMVIGMLDGGFRNYLSVRAFDSARARGQILSTYDFVNSELSVNEDDAHGMECFSTIASNIPGTFVGTAPKASFHLFRSEDSGSEYPIEEHNWVCAAERVDSLGGDLISSSLGYTTFDAPLESESHSYSELDGNHTMAVIGADLAAKKGIIVVNAAGNDGASAWHFIGTPADGDSVLAVGAVDASGKPASFSSFGPSADKQIKPDVASVGVGTTVQFANGSIGGSNGTSFAAPNLAGLITCLWQAFPESGNMQIIDALRKSGSRSTHPDDSIGYGVPDMRKAFMILTKTLVHADANITDCDVKLTWESKDAAGMRYDIERKLQNESGFSKIASVQATGTLGIHQYEYSNALIHAAAGKVQYRIFQVVDTAGERTQTFAGDYIDTVSVESKTDCGTMGAIRVFPNPSRNQTTLTVSTDAATNALVIDVYDSKGQLVHRQKTTKGPGTAFFDLPARFLAAGKYYVIVYSEGSRLGMAELLKL